MNKCDQHLLYVLRSVITEDLQESFEEYAVYRRRDDCFLGVLVPRGQWHATSTDGRTASARLRWEAAVQLWPE